MADSTICGVVAEQKTDNTITFNSVLSNTERFVIVAYTVVYAFVGGFFLYLLFSSFTPRMVNTYVLVFSVVGFFALAIIEVLRLFQGFTIPYFALRAKDPVYLKPAKGYRVALLTTIVPSKEPIEIVERTLVAMKKIKYDGTVDVWILDEGNDDRVKEMAVRIGVKHFSRKGIEKFNQASGEFKARTKAGNHNSWRAENEQYYDIVAQMDPDHVPFKNFLERILGYFTDPTVGFVVAPQVYGNQKDSFIARASAEQAYIFHGIIQRAGNASYTPLLIGTNHAYRTTAWKEIGGYQDSIIEDHLTSIKLHSSNVGTTTHKWKGVYTPDIVSIGEGPTTWTDYFNQQKRWAYGVWEIMLTHNPKYFFGLKASQKMHYAALQSFYPSISLSWMLSLFVSLITLVYGITFLDVDLRTFMAVWFASILLQVGFSVWVMRFNLTPYERNSTGLSATLLTLLVAPVYTAAAIAAITKRKLNYAVTAKGDLRTLDTWNTFSSHFVYLACYTTLAVIAVTSARTEYVSFYWAVFTLVVLLPLPLMFVYTKVEVKVPRFNYLMHVAESVKSLVL
jgi:cellulose synthase/poly-beta-1,6-N-acetylglucosamine synthase-like glycosyltransferase